MIRFEELTAPIPAPANLLPTGLPDLIPGLQQEGTLRSVLYQLKPVNPASSDPDASIGALGIAEFQTDALSQDPFSALVPSLPADDADLAAQITLGPRIPDPELLVPSALPEPQLRITPRAPLADIGIIDAGICFWNPTFWNEVAGVKVSRFASFGGLKLSAQQITHDRMTREKIEQLLEKTETEIRDDLAKAFPGSVYSDTAPAPLFPANRLAHGTAMAELVTSSALAINNLHGLELPISVLRDLTGGLMSAVLEMALRAMIEQMIETAKEQKQARSMVILMAFGFTGGPLNGTSKILEGMNKVLDSYRSKGHQVTLVLPIGNHLQDRLHAHLEDNQDVIWRIQPDDHSANTVELIHPQTAELHLAAPNGDYVRIPSEKEGLHRIVHDDTPVGACWTTVNQLDSSMQTRIALLPTAISRPNVPFAQPGQWHLKCKRGHADLWILRDERGFEPDPFHPTRASWFEDTNYREKDDTGEPARTDAPLIPNRPNPVVKRQGSASVLASSQNDSVLVVTAEEDDGKLAYYASLLPQGKMQANNGHAIVKTSLSQNARPEHAPIGPFVGRAVLGNGGPDRFRVLGTSLAAALAAGTLAAQLSGSEVGQ